MILPILGILLALQLSPQTPDQITQLLRAKDQAMLDAIAVGNRKVWDEELAPDAVYVDENRTIIGRSKFLKQMEPLPAGVSGTLRIAEYSAHISGDLALVIHTDAEEENYHGQILHAQYLTTETWRRESEEWKLHLVHAYAVLQDPPAITLTPDAMKQYAGRYSGGSDLVYIIQWDGKELVGGRQGGPMKPLKAELRDVLFAPGQPRIRKIFQRDVKGNITGFVDRREGEDLVWRRQP